MADAVCFDSALAIAGRMSCGTEINGDGGASNSSEKAPVSRTGSLKTALFSRQAERQHRELRAPGILILADCQYSTKCYCALDYLVLGKIEIASLKQRDGQPMKVALIFFHNSKYLFPFCPSAYC